MAGGAVIRESTPQQLQPSEPWSKLLNRGLSRVHMGLSRVHMGLSRVHMGSVQRATKLQNKSFDHDSCAVLLIFRGSFRVWSPVCSDLGEGPVRYNEYV